VAVAVAAIALGACAAITGWTIGLDLLSPGSDVAVEGLHFGEVHAQNKFPWALQVRNLSPYKVDVINFRTSCTCSKVTPEQVVLEPNGSATLHVTLDLKKVFKDDILEQKRPVAVKIGATILREGQSHRATWELRGTVLDDIIPETSTVQFPVQLIEGERPEKSAATILHAFEELHDWEVHAEENCPFEIAFDPPRDDGLTRRIKIDLRPSLPAGYYQSDLTVTAKRADGVATFPCTLTLVARVFQRIELMPASLDLGPRDVGVRASGEVVLTSRLGNQFEVLNAIVPKPEVMQVDLAPMGDANLGAWQARISTDIATNGNFSEELRFAVREVDGKGKSRDYEVPLVVSAYGMGQRTTETASDHSDAKAQVED
jgi:hypothetical protein